MCQDKKETRSEECRLDEEQKTACASAREEAGNYLFVGGGFSGTGAADEEEDDYW